MVDVVNLRRARKARTRAKQDDMAAENRVRFGVSKAARVAAAKEGQRAAKALDSHRASDGDSTGAGAPGSDA